MSLNFKIIIDKKNKEKIEKIIKRIDNNNYKINMERVNVSFKDNFFYVDFYGLLDSKAYKYIYNLIIFISYYYSKKEYDKIRNMDYPVFFVDDVETVYVLSKKDYSNLSNIEINCGNEINGFSFEYSYLGEKYDLSKIRNPLKFYSKYTNNKIMEYIEFILDTKT